MPTGYRAGAEALSVRSLCLEPWPNVTQASTSSHVRRLRIRGLGTLRTSLSQLEKNIPLKPLRRYLCPPRSPHAGP